MQRDGGVIISWANIRGGHRLAACFAFIKLALSRPLSSPPFHSLLSLQLLIKADIKGIKCGVIVGRERGHETIPRYFFPYLSSRFRGIIQTMSIIRFQRLVRPFFLLPPLFDQDSKGGKLISFRSIRCKIN